jgi:hypothetical protein
VLTIVDALCTGPWVGASWMPPALAEGLAILFVILGDLRWFFFYELFRRRPLGALGFATGWSLVVPITQAGIIRLFPEYFAESRHVFLAYELLFFLLASGFLCMRQRPQDQAVSQYQRQLCLYALTYYGMWALADVVILNGMDLGFLLRVIPNQLYYAWFLPFCWWRAQRLGLLEPGRVGGYT